MSKNKISSNFHGWRIFFLLALVVLAGVLKLYSLYIPTTKISINGQVLEVLVAKNYNHLYKGLGKRKDLGNHDGMLFVFNSRNQHTMVMRDMRFSIDIIWIDGDVIVDIAPNVQTEIGKKEGEYIPYLAREKSTHVLEVASGSVQKFGWKIGDRIEYNP